MDRDQPSQMEQLAQLLDIAEVLRDLPREEFKASLKADLERRATMTTTTAKAVTKRPEGIYSVTPYLIGAPASGLVDFMKQAFDATELQRHSRPDGAIMHTAVKIGDTILELSDPSPGDPARPMALHLYVPDADEVYRRAIEAGATSLAEPVDQSYGDREASVKDQSGNFWYIATHKAGASHIPEGLHSVTVFLHPQSADQLIAFLKEAFEAEVVGRFQSPEGRVAHATVRVGDTIVEMSDAHGPWQPMPATLHFYVDDCDAVYERALRAGAKALSPVEDRPYGERNGGVEDPAGHSWYIATPFA